MIKKILPKISKSYKSLVKKIKAHFKKRLRDGKAGRKLQTKKVVELDLTQARSESLVEELEGMERGEAYAKINDIVAECDAIKAWTKDAKWTTKSVLSSFKRILKKLGGFEKCYDDLRNILVEAIEGNVESRRAYLEGREKLRKKYEATLGCDPSRPGIPELELDWVPLPISLPLHLIHSGKCPLADRDLRIRIKDGFDRRKLVNCTEPGEFERYRLDIIDFRRKNTTTTDEDESEFSEFEDPALDQSTCEHVFKDSGFSGLSALFAKKMRRLKSTNLGILKTGGNMQWGRMKATGENSRIGPGFLRHIGDTTAVLIRDMHLWERYLQVDDHERFQWGHWAINHATDSDTLPCLTSGLSGMQKQITLLPQIPSEGIERWKAARKKAAEKASGLENVEGGEKESQVEKEGSVEGKEEKSQSDSDKSEVQPSSAELKSEIPVEKNVSSPPKTARESSSSIRFESVVCESIVAEEDVEPSIAEGDEPSQVEADLEEENDDSEIEDDASDPEAESSKSEEESKQSDVSSEQPDEFDAKPNGFFDKSNNTDGEFLFANRGYKLKDLPKEYHHIEFLLHYIGEPEYVGQFLAARDFWSKTRGKERDSFLFGVFPSESIITKILQHTMGIGGSLDPIGGAGATNTYLLPDWGKFAGCSTNVGLVGKSIPELSQSPHVVFDPVEASTIGGGLRSADKRVLWEEIISTAEKVEQVRSEKKTEEKLSLSLQTDAALRGLLRFATRFLFINRCDQRLPVQSIFQCFCKKCRYCQRYDPQLRFLIKNRHELLQYASQGDNTVLLMDQCCRFAFDEESKVEGEESETDDHGRFMEISDLDQCLFRGAVSENLIKLVHYFILDRKERLGGLNMSLGDWENSDAKKSEKTLIWLEKGIQGHSAPSESSENESGENELEQDNKEPVAASNPATNDANALCTTPLGKPNVGDKSRPSSPKSVKSKRMSFSVAKSHKSSKQVRKSEVSVKSKRSKSNHESCFGTSRGSEQLRDQFEDIATSFGSTIELGYDEYSLLGRNYRGETALHTAVIEDLPRITEVLIEGLIKHPLALVLPSAREAQEKYMEADLIEDVDYLLSHRHEPHPSEPVKRRMKEITSKLVSRAINARTVSTRRQGIEQLQDLNPTQIAGLESGQLQDADRLDGSWCLHLGFSWNRSSGYSDKQIRKMKLHMRRHYGPNASTRRTVLHSIAMENLFDDPDCEVGGPDDVYHALLVRPAMLLGGKGLPWDFTLRDSAGYSVLHRACNNWSAAEMIKFILEKSPLLCPSLSEEERKEKPYLCNCEKGAHFCESAFRMLWTDIRQSQTPGVRSTADSAFTIARRPLTESDGKTGLWEDYHERTVVICNFVREKILNNTEVHPSKISRAQMAALVLRMKDRRANPSLFPGENPWSYSTSVRLQWEREHKNSKEPFQSKPAELLELEEEIEKYGGLNMGTVAINFF